MCVQVEGGSCLYKLCIESIKRGRQIKRQIVPLVGAIYHVTPFRQLLVNLTASSDSLGLVHYSTRIFDLCTSRVSKSATTLKIWNKTLFFFIPDPFAPTYPPTTPSPSESNPYLTDLDVLWSPSPGGDATTPKPSNPHFIGRGLNENLIPIYCSILAAVVVGLLAYIIFKRSATKLNQKDIKADHQRLWTGLKNVGGVHQPIKRTQCRLIKCYLRGFGSLRNS